MAFSAVLDSHRQLPCNNPLSHFLPYHSESHRCSCSQSDTATERLFSCFIAMSVLSVVAGLRLWLVRPDAVRFARGYLVTSLIANIAYFMFWIIVMRPTKQVAFAQMGWYHVVGPSAAFALWYSYLEHSMAENPRDRLAPFLIYGG